MMLRSFLLFFCFMVLFSICSVFASQSVPLDEQSWTTLSTNSQSIVEVDDKGISFGLRDYRGVIHAVSQQQYDLRDATVYLKWQIHGPPGKYTAFIMGIGWPYENSPGTYLAAKALGPEKWFTTDHSWDGSKLVQDDIWYYTRIDVSSDKSVEVVTSTTNYDDRGGVPIASYHFDLTHDNWKRLSQAFIIFVLLDNYGGDKTRLLLGEVLISSGEEDGDPTIASLTPSSYASYDVDAALVCIPNMDIMGSSYWLELAVLPTHPLTFQLVNLGEGGSGSTCATYDIENNILHIKPICIGLDCWNVALSLTSFSPVTLQLVDIRHVYPPTISVDRTLLFETIITPSSQEQTIMDPTSKIKIVLPAGSLSDAIQFSLSSVNNMPLPMENVYWSKVVDIDLGEKHLFSRPVLIELPLEMDNLPNDVGAEDLHVLHWNRSLNVWEFMSKEVNLERGVIIVKTRTLSPIAWVCSILDNYVYSPDKLFKIYYDTDDWSDSNGLPDQSITDFARRIGGYFDNAFHAYKQEGFKTPDTPFNVMLYKRFQVLGYNLDGETHYSNGSVGKDAIYFEIRKTSIKETQHDAAHELFHAIQNKYLSGFEMGSYDDHWLDIFLGSDTKWLIEAMADLAASEVVSQGDHKTLQPLTMEFFANQLSFLDGVHEYQAAHFLSFLKRQSNISMKDFWEDIVFNVSSGIVTRTAITALQGFVSTHLNNTLENLWRDFVLYTLLDKRSTFGTDRDSIGFPLSARSSDLTVLRTTETHKDWLCQLKSDLTAKTWAIRPQIAAGDTLRKLILKAERDIPHGVEIYITLIEDYHDNYRVKHIKTLTYNNSSNPVDIIAKAGDVIFVIATEITTGVGSSIKTLHLKLSDAPYCSIRSDGGELEQGISRGITLSCNVYDNPTRLWADLSPIGGPAKLELKSENFCRWTARATVKPTSSGVKNIKFEAQNAGGNSSQILTSITVKTADNLANTVSFHDPTGSMMVTLVFPNDIHARVETVQDSDSYTGQLVKIYLKEFLHGYAFSDLLPVTFSIKPNKSLRKWILYSNSGNRDRTFRKLKYVNEDGSLMADIKINGEPYYWLTFYPEHGPYYTLIFRLYGDKR